MKTKRKLFKYLLSGIFLCCGSTVFPGAAVTAETIFLKNDCAGIQNCFSAIPDLVDWIDTQRFPDQTDPLLVEIGPGRFKGPFQCIDHSGITLRGSGRGNTVIYGDKSFIPGNVLFAPGMNLRNCNSLNVTDLRVEGDYGAIWWDGSGKTTWTDVDVAGGGRGWYEFGNCDAETTSHTWFNSRIISRPYVTSSVAYSSFCGQAVFHNSELSANATSVGKNGLGWGDLRALWVQGGTAVVYGGALRTTASITPMNQLAAFEVVRVRDGEARLLNTSIEAQTSVDYPVSVLRAEAGGSIRGISSAFLLPDDNPLITRIDLAGGTVNSDFHWGARITPPDIISVTGADRYIETDCADTGCQTPGTASHSMVYNGECQVLGPWFDTVTARCRGL